VFKSKAEVKDLQSFLEIETKVEFINEDESFLNENYSMNMIQTKIEHISANDLRQGYFILAQQTPNRLFRFLGAFLIVLVQSLGCFLFIKSSVDWATASQTELNKIKMTQFEDVTKKVKEKFSFIVNTES
jgi:translation elongation factor EF-1alpha